MGVLQKNMNRRERILAIPQSILCTEIERCARVTMRDNHHRTFWAQNVGNFRDTA